MSTTPLHPPVLVVDDKPDVRLALSMLLRSDGFDVVEAAMPAAACEIAARQVLSCALVDLNFTADTTSGHEGLELVSRLGQVAPSLPVAVMTAWGSIDIAVEAMRRGAKDFIEKPWEGQRLLATVWNQVGLQGARGDNQRQSTDAGVDRDGPGGLRITESSSMRRVLDLIARIAPEKANVLILGENGTGKSLFARDIHVRSRRCAAPLVRVDMGSLAEARFDGELFGDETGAGQFELAHRGSLIMEEVSSIPLHHQAKFLRVLSEGELERLGSAQTRQVDVRVISTTNADLDAAVREQRFRADLLYRLNALKVRLPSLRERAEDIIPLARHFLLRECRRRGRDAARFTPAAERVMRAHAWPGNIRELEHAVERAVLTTPGSEIDIEALALRPDEGPPLILDRLTLPEAEELVVAHALERHDHNLRRTAAALGISRQALYRRLGKRRQ